MLAAALMLAPSAGAVVVRQPDGHLQGMQLKPGVSAARAGESQAAGTNLRALGPSNCPTDPDNGTVCYLGGPVLHTSDPYLVFWDPDGQIPTNSQDVIERYLTDVAADTGEADDVYGVERQYYDSSGFAAQHQSFSVANQVVTDTATFPTGFPSDCPQVSGYTSCVTDHQIENQITNLIENDGYPSGTGPGAPIYFVITPATTDVCDGGASDCANNSFCGYHGNFTVGGQQVVYAVVPFGSLGPSAEDILSCQGSNLTYPQEPNGDPADEIVDDLSHENSESTTDPVVDTGWEDTNSTFTAGSENEIADNCQGYGATPDPAAGESPNVYFPILGDTSPAANSVTYGTAYDQVINGDHYFTQTEWSNGDQTCEPYPAGATVTPAFTDSAPATPSDGVTFNPAATSAANGISSATWSFGDGQTQFTPGSAATVTHQYASAGDYTVTLTIVDNSGDLATVSHTVAIGAAPTAAFTSTPGHAAATYPVQFNGGASTDTNPGARITAYAWSFGDGTTATGATPTHTFTKPSTYSVQLKVTDSLGLSATKTVSLTVLAPGKITRIAPAKVGTGEDVVVTVSEPGKIAVGSKSVVLHGAGSGSFPVGAAPARGHRLSVKVTVVYTPEAGPVVRKAYSTVVAG
jgi:PKD repeat protein